MSNKGNKKGAVAEEGMRQAFRKMGYFVVRGIPYSFREYHLTDIDLWLYSVAGAFRERINVDIKHKRTPQAIERIFWTLGVTRVLRLTNCIVVTTETNPAVLEFGRRSGVTVIDGNYLQQAIATLEDKRLSEEEFIEAILPVEAEEVGRSLRRRYEGGKRRLIINLTYDGVNLYLLDIRACMEDMASYSGLGKSIRRVLYVLVSYLLITLDYLMSESAFLSEKERSEEVEEGLRYGSAGKGRLDDFIRLLSQCKAPRNRQVNDVIEGIAEELKSGADGLKADIVAEYISHQVGSKRLFDLACTLEDAAFTPDCPTVAVLPSDVKSLILVIVDFFGLDRKSAMYW
jgi:hypothetical protein